MKISCRLNPVAKAFAIFLSIASQATFLSPARGARLEAQSSETASRLAAGSTCENHESRTQAEGLPEIFDALALSVPSESQSSPRVDSSHLSELGPGPLTRWIFRSRGMQAPAYRMYCTEIARASPTGPAGVDLPHSREGVVNIRNPLLEAHRQRNRARVSSESAAAAATQFHRARASGSVRSRISAMDVDQVIAAIRRDGEDFPFHFLSESQWDKLPYHLQDRWGSNVGSCCKPVSTGGRHPDDLRFEIVRFDSKRDPLVSGKPFNNTSSPGVSGDQFSVTQNTPMRDGIEYQYAPPRELGSPHQLSGFRLRIPRKLEGEDELAYLERRFQNSNIVPAEFTLSNLFRSDTLHGSTARVFFPVDGAPNRWPTLVLKLRFPFPWLEDEDEPTESISPSHFNEDQSSGYAEAYDTARADLALTYPVKQCAENFRVSSSIDRWHPSSDGSTGTSSGAGSEPTWSKIIQVHEYLDYKQFWRQGIFLQERVRAGMSAYTLARYVILYTQAEQRGDTTRMQELLEYINQYDINDINEAKTLLALIEKFYEVVQFDLLKFRRENNLKNAQNYVESDAIFDNYLIDLGLDYNRGANVLWSKVDHRWHIIDF